MSSLSASRSPHWYGVPVRVGLLTFIGTLICFAVSLLLAIVGTVGVAAIRGIHPDMRVAYRHIALPMAIVAGAIILVIASIMEVRHYRQLKALSAIERMN
jgi:uncharacterized membrane protein